MSYVNADKACENDTTDTEVDDGELCVANVGMRGVGWAGLELPYAANKAVMRRMPPPLV